MCRLFHSTYLIRIFTSSLTRTPNTTAFLYQVIEWPNVRELFVRGFQDGVMPESELDAAWLKYKVQCSTRRVKHENMF